MYWYSLLGDGLEGPSDSVAALGKKSLTIGLPYIWTVPGPFTKLKFLITHIKKIKLSRNSKIIHKRIARGDYKTQKYLRKHYNKYRFASKSMANYSPKKTINK